MSMPRVFRVLRKVYHGLVPASVRGSGLLQRMSVGFARRAGTHDDIYTERYYREFVDAGALAVAPTIADLIVGTFRPKTVTDVGCGTGAMLQALAARGCEVRGLEYSDAALAICRERGLEVTKFDIEAPAPAPAKRCDVALSTEVAEHLPAACADRFVDLLVGLAPVVVMTAATPGQGGRDHVNEQPHEYWIGKFATRGYELQPAQTDAWRATLREAGVETCYSANMMVFHARPIPG